MASSFWTFVEACDETQTPRATTELFAAAMRELGFVTYAIFTHAPPADLRSLGVLVHNWPAEALDHLFGFKPSIRLSPLLEEIERSNGPFIWGAHPRREALNRQQRAWFTRLQSLLGGGEGVSCSLRSPIVGASCSVTGPAPSDPDRIRLCMRIANYAYQQIVHLQRPQVSEPERLTAREHESLYRATILGERPSDVAVRLGVKISTVRTLRQKASIRLDATSQEQAAWRMLETGQLFRCGRKGRPRSR